MSFNKGFLNKSMIDIKYSEGGVKSIIRLLKSYDAFICEDDYTSELINYYMKGKVGDFFSLNLQSIKL